MTRDLYLTTYAPTLGTGRAMRTYSCVRALAMLGPIDLAYVLHDSTEPCEAFQAIDNLEFHEIKPSRGLRRAMLYTSQRAKGIPSACCRGTSPEVIAIGEALARMPGRGRVIVGDGNSATAMMSTAHRQSIIYNAHNIESDYVQARPGVRYLARHSMRSYERRLIALAAESWMVSHTDIETARKLVPDARLRYVPNVVDVAAIKPTCSRDETRTPTLMMVGDFTYQPNRGGLDFLVKQVLPAVWRRLPGARLRLVGRGMQNWSTPDQRIEVAGFVEHLEPFYAASDCITVPLIEGAGTPLKFIEALAYGVPVVATSRASRGLSVRPGVHYRQADSAEHFADQILDVLGSDTSEMTREGRRLAEREYSIEALAELLDQPKLAA
jgi:polysaccharide biosynthesis protein PslH